MDEMEKKEELEQEMEQPVAEKIDGTEMAEEPAEGPGETTEEAAEKAPDKGGSNLLAILVGIAAFIAILAYCWMNPAGGVKDTGVLYAKNNGLYFYDLKNEPYLLQEEISAGGTYHYFYSAWGAEVAEEGDWVYYSGNIDATGGFDLYRKDAKKPGAEAQFIDDNVYDYMASKDGEVVAYLAAEGDALELRCFDGSGGWVVAEGMHLTDDVYSLSGDGRYLVYTDAYGMLCAAETDAVYAPVVLTDAAAMYAIAEEANILYFVAQGAESYHIYSYAFDGEEPALVAENAAYMELMPNGRDLLYGITPGDIIPYTELVVDDMAEVDETLREGSTGYEQKLQRDALREAMANGEGIQPLLQEYYVLANGNATLVAENVISAVAVDSEKPFVTGYKAMDFEPVPMSMLGGGTEMVEMVYYMTLNYGGMEAFLTDGSGNLEVLSGEVQLDTITVSADGSSAAYAATDTDTGETLLMRMEIGEAAEAAIEDKNVESMRFLGDSNWLGYYTDYSNGVGTLHMGDGPNMENACGVEYAEDEKAMYFIQAPDSSTGNGTLICWTDHEKVQTIDENVFAFQYKGNGKLAYLKDYSVTEGRGDLYYFNGKESRLLDEDITAIFMY